MRSLNCFTDEVLSAFDACSDRPHVVCPARPVGDGDATIVGANAALVIKAAVDGNPSMSGVLVDGDPLSALLAIAALRPATVVISVSKQSEWIAPKLRSAVAGLSIKPKPKVQTSVVANANDAREVVVALRALRLGREPWNETPIEFSARQVAPSSSRWVRSRSTRRALGPPLSSGANTFEFRIARKSPGTH